MKKLFLGVLYVLPLVPSIADDKPVLFHLVERASEIVVLKIVRAENGSVISEDSTIFRIVGTVQKSLHGNLRLEDRVTIKVSNPLRNRDMNPITVRPDGTYIAFLNPSYYVDSSKISHYRIQDPPFGISPLTTTLLADTKRRIETKANKASHSSPDRAESK